MFQTKNKISSLYILTCLYKKKLIHGKHVKKSIIRNNKKYILFSLNIDMQCFFFLKKIWLHITLI
jgi:hypothetical protein